MPCIVVEFASIVPNMIVIFSSYKGYEPHADLRKACAEFAEEVRQEHNSLDYNKVYVI